MDRKVRWLVWGAYVAVWTTMLLLPVGAIQRLPGQEMPESKRYLVAKAVHVAAYAVMTVLCGWLHVPARYRWLLVFFLMGHATLTETIQQDFPELGRIGALHDVVFDQVGIVIGFLASWKWWVKEDEQGRA